MRQTSNSRNNHQLAFILNRHPYFGRHIEILLTISSEIASSFSYHFFPPSFELFVVDVFKTQGCPKIIAQIILARVMGNVDIW